MRTIVVLMLAIGAAGLSAAEPVVIADFEGTLFYADLAKKDNQIAVATEHATGGSNSLKLTLAKGKSHRLGGSQDNPLPADWTGFGALRFDVFNDTGKEAELEVKIKSFEDAENKKSQRLYQVFTLPPGASVQKLSLAGRKDIALTNIDYVLLTNKGSDEAVLFVDTVTLEPAADYNPQRPLLVRLSITGDSRTTMTVTFQSDAGTAAAVRIKGGKTFKGTAEKAYAGLGGVFHEVTLTGLKPGTEYTYEISADGKRFFPGNTFRTAPARTDTPFTFAACADTKDGRGILAGLIGRLDAQIALMIYAGDAPQSGGYRHQWDNWFRTVEPLAARVPVMLSSGNHEAVHDWQLVNYERYATNPAGAGTEKYYSFDYGAVHFVACETETDVEDKQLQWLRKDLQQARASRDTKWLVAFFHSPPFSSGDSHGCDMEVRRRFVPILTEFKTDLVFSGDDHIYERSKPMQNDKVVASYAEGTCYIISAGAGADLYKIKEGNPWTAKAVTGVSHMTTVTVTDRELQVRTTGLDGKVLDEFTIEPKK